MVPNRTKASRRPDGAMSLGEELTPNPYSLYSQVANWPAFSRPPKPDGKMPARASAEAWCRAVAGLWRAQPRRRYFLPSVRQPPWPLQAFWPLQACLSVLQPPCPLQAF